LGGFCKVIIDDILVHSSSFEEHMDHLQQVFTMLTAIGMKLHPDKSVFCCSEVEFLGHVISQDGISPSEAKVKTIRDLPTPANVPALRQVLGFMNYYRVYVPNFSSVAKPLNNLLKNDTPWTWRPEVEGAAYQELKDRLLSAL
jgi:hypothetical protein